MDLNELDFLKITSFPMNEGIIILDPDHLTILHINPKMERILGYKSSELYGRDFDYLLGESGTIFKIFEIMGSSDSNKQIVLWQLLSKTGEAIEIDFNFQLINATNEESSYLIFYIQDKTEISNLQIKINFTQNLLKAIREIKLAIFLNKSKQDILYTTCLSLQKARGFDLVWGIYQGSEDEYLFEFSSKSKETHRKFDSIKKLFLNNQNETPISNVLNNPINFLYFYSNQKDFKYKKWYDTLIDGYYMDALCFQISWNNKVYGAIEVINFSKFAITEDDISTLQELGADIGFAFYNQENEEMKAMALKQIEYQGILLDNIEVPIVALDKNAMINYANQSAERVLNYTFAEMKKVKANKLLGQSESFLEYLRRRSNTKEINVLNNRTSQFSAMLHSSPIIGDFGEFMGIMLVLFDITEQKEQENRIRESEAKLRNIFTGMNNGIVIVDNQGNIKDVAPVLKFYLFQYLNLEEKQKLFYFLPNEIAESFYETIQRCLFSTKVETSEFKYRLMDTETYFSVRFIPMKKYNQFDEAVMCIFTDITNTKNLNHQLVESAKFASIGELAAGIAHEINNPLQSALLYIEDLIENDESDANERIKILKKIELANKRIRNLIKSLLDLGRTEIAEKEITEIDWIITRAIELVEANAKKKSIFIEFKTYAKNLNANVRWQEIEQVIINCLMNSINALSEADFRNNTPKIEIIVDKQENKDQNWINILIQDNGPGIKEKDMNKVFMPMYTTRRENQGTGLGLFISKKIITDHGGDIEFSSTFKNGSQLRIKLPIGI
ncbi:MAG: PAS domain S-box protein [Leptospira sp.]|nr:PAS domain S-box protein [Leptospira sp.]